MTSIAPDLETVDDEPELPAVADVATDGAESEPAEADGWDDDEDDDEPLETEDAAEGDTPAADPTDDAVPTPDASASAPAEPDEPPEPVTIEWDGGSYTIPGATFDHKNNALKFDDMRGVKRFHTLLKHGVTFEATRAKYEKQEQRHAAALESVKADAEQFMAALGEVMNLPDGEFDARILEFRAQFPQLRQDMERQRYEARIAELEGRNKQPDEFPGMAPEHVQEMAESRVIQDIEGAAKQLAWMTEECVNELRAVMTHPNNVARYVKYADAETVRQAAEAGERLQLGQPWIDWQEYRAISRPIAKAWETAHSKMAQAKADAAKQVQTLGKTAQQNGKILAAATPAPAKAAPKPVATPTKEETDEERYERERNELGQFIRDAARSSRVRVRR